MVPCTRRRALQGATALLAGLAGCSGSGSSSSSRSFPPETPENVETDPDHYVLRHSRPDPPAWVRPEGATERPADSTRTTDDRHRGHARTLIATRSTAARLGFADADGVDGARRFVERTDFERETILLDGQSVEECYRLELCYVTWSATDYHTYYARPLRPVDVACSADARGGVSTLIRIPDALDPEQVTGSGSGVTSGTCERWEHRLEHRREEAREHNSTGQTAASTEAASGGGR